MGKQTFEIAEIIKNEDFIYHVERILRDLIKRRLERPQPKKGFKYRRDWYDRMQPKGMIEASFFLQNIGDIWLKKSHLSSSDRGVILFVCNQAFREVMLKLEASSQNSNILSEVVDPSEIGRNEH